jgi:hypothetical protein
MEAAMRLRSPSHIIFAAVSLAAAAHCSRATAQIEFAKSTIRIVPASEVVDKPAAPVRIVAEPIASPAPAVKPLPQPEPIAQIAAPPVEHTAPANQYPVRQADFVTAPASRPLIHAPVPARAPSMVNVYSSAAAQSTLSKMPRPAPVHRQTTTTAPPKPARGKPFQDVQSEPVISPYMNLYRNDINAPTLSNYLTMVRPQLEQQQISRQQTAEIQKLRGQLQNLSGGGSGTSNTGSMTAHAHYMDTAQFYRGTRR